MNKRTIALACSLGATFFFAGLIWMEMLEVALLLAVIGFVVPLMAASSKHRDKNDKDTKPEPKPTLVKPSSNPKLYSHILHPNGKVTIKRITSHRAFQYKWGLYEVKNIFTLPNLNRMMLHSVGKSAAWNGDEDGNEDVGIADKTFTSMMLETTSFKKGHMRKPLHMPSWAIALAMMAMIVVIIWITQKP